jgi:hypothetical protein
MGFRQQILMTLVLMPITFALWYAAGSLLVGPAAWMAGAVLSGLYSSLIASAGLSDTLFVVSAEFGSLNGTIVSAQQAGNELVFEINTRLVSYSIPFYAALLWSSKLSTAMNRFALGLFVLWIAMAIGLIVIAMKELMLAVGTPFLEATGVPPAPLIALSYQFSVLVAPTLMPVLLWLIQLRGTPLWVSLQSRLTPKTAE